MACQHHQSHLPDLRAGVPRPWHVKMDGCVVYPILHRFQVMAHYWSIFACENRPPHFNSLATNFQTIFTSPETRMIVLREGENRTSRHNTSVWRKTDRRTDRLARG